MDGSDFGGLGEYESLEDPFASAPFAPQAPPPPQMTQQLGPGGFARRGPPEELFPPPMPHPSMMRRHGGMQGMGADTSGQTFFPPAPPPPAPSPAEALPTSHLLGLSVIMPATGTIVGMKYAGMYGGLGGALGMGSLINGYRAMKYMVQGTPEADREAMISGTYAVLGLSAAAYLIYKGLKSKSPKALPNEDSDLEGVL